MSRKMLRMFSPVGRWWCLRGRGEVDSGRVGFFSLLPLGLWTPGARLFWVWPAGVLGGKEQVDRGPVDGRCRCLPADSALMATPFCSVVAQPV